MSKSKDLVERPKIVGEIRKPNEAIAIRPTMGSSLTFLTRKLYNTMLYHAQKHTRGTRVFRMPLRTITRGASFESNDIGLLREHLKKMKRTEVEWNDPGKVWGISSLVSAAEIKKENGELVLEWEYSTKIEKLILEPESKYTSLTLEHQAMMRTHAGLALLELCLQYETFHKGMTASKAWEWWYGVLTGNIDVDVVAARPYFYRYFKRDTIMPAINEVNTLTDFNVELDEDNKNGRKVIGFRFLISKKAQKEIGLEDRHQMFDISLISRMISLGLRESDAQKIYAAHEENIIRAALDFTEKKLRSKSRPESPAAYFRSALNGGWLSDSESKQTPAAQAKALAQMPDLEPADPAREAAMAAFERLPIADQKRRLELFAETLAAPLQQKYVSEGLGSVLVRKAFEAWLAKTG